MTPADYVKLLWAVVAAAALFWGVFKYFHRRKNVVHRSDLRVSFPRDKFRIAIVDDEVEDWITTEHRHRLSNRGFTVDYFEDIDNIRDLQQHQIVLCDVKDVGQNIGVNRDAHGGIIVAELRHYRPMTYIVMYSRSAAFDPEFNRYFSLADEVSNKASLSGEKIVELLDRATRVLSSPDEQWKRFKKYVLGQKADEIELSKMAKIQTSFMREFAEANTAFEERLNHLNLGRKAESNESPIADLAIDASELAEKLLQLFSRSQ